MSIPAVQKANQQQMHCLDMLRGTACVVVAVHHCGWLNSATNFGIVEYAGVLVDFFFVISGFVISYSYDGKLAEGASMKGFMIKRFWRLWPLHFVTMLAFIGIEVLRLGFEISQGTQLSPPAFGDGYGWAIVANVLLVHSLGFLQELPAINAVSWSISVEFYTYLVFALVCLTGRFRLALFSLLALGSMLILYTYHGRLAGEATTYGMFRCLYSFGIGFLAFRIFAALKAPSRRIWRGWLNLLAVGILLFVVTWMAGAVGRTPGEILSPPILAVAMLALLLAERPGDYDHPLLQPLVWVGKVSFSLYMVHLAVNWFFVQGLRVALGWPSTTVYEGTEKLDGGLLAGNLLLLVYVAAVLVVSAITYRFVEDRFRRGVKPHNAVVAHPNQARL